MNAGPPLSARYAAGLHAYLADGGESALSAAYELGRNALESGGTIMDMVGAHEAALAPVLGRGDPAAISSRAAQFLVESLVPFEMADRSFMEANKQLQALNTELEERVERRTQDLADANAELEAFAYTAADDLRAPLRAIEGFSDILLSQHADELDEESRHLLDGIGANVIKMGALIDDLLRLSQVRREQLDVHRVPMADLATAVLDELLEYESPRRAAIIMSTLDDVAGDARLLREVWANLLSNALKFTANEQTPEIRIRSKCTDSEIVYTVEDNGVGFDMAYADKLFDVFQRLHSADFPGTGVGLAIVKRIVSKHGGRVWAEAEPGEGARFSFAIPRCTERGAGAGPDGSRKAS